MTPWKIWCKAIGSKEGNTDREADTVAIVRTLFILLTITTEGVIIASNIHHW